MTVTTGHVVIKKDASNLIGISIGGGSPYCPCIYIVQVKYTVNLVDNNFIIEYFI